MVATATNAQPPPLAASPGGDVEDLDALNNVRVRKKGGKATTQSPGKASTARSIQTRSPKEAKARHDKLTVKVCAFMCGHKNTDPDPEDPANEEKRIRWAYPDGSGSYDWVCERIFQGYYAHKWSDRLASQAALKKDLKLFG